MTRARRLSSSAGLRHIKKRADHEEHLTELQGWDSKEGRTSRQFDRWIKRNVQKISHSGPSVRAKAGARPAGFFIIDPMPELPEVEVLVRHLNSQLPGKRITGVSVARPRVIRPDSPATLAQALTGWRFCQVERRAKFLVFRLKAGSPPRQRVLVGHLGMTGRMFLQSRNHEPSRWTAVTLELGRERLVFEDLRGFGRLHLDPRVLERLGPEPLAEEFTAEQLAHALKGSVQPVKVRLMDQSVVAGIGNIYASEALFRAGISPRRMARRLKTEQVEALWLAVRRVLQEAIDGGSTLPLDFASGRDGLFYYGSEVEAEGAGYEERLQVYGREDQPCLQCQSPVRRIVQAARSTFFCPQCQRG